MADPPPPFSQIQSVLNHLWGKGKRLEIHNNPSSRSVHVRITSDYLKQKILEKGYWYVGDSLFHTQQWTSTTRSTAPSFSSIKIWAHLTGIPLDLRHQDGLSLVVGLVGEPKETDDFTKNLVSLTLAHAKVEVDLTKPLPDVVEFTRQSGEVVEVLVAYPWLPPTCSHCKELGHIAKNCLLIPPPQKAPPPPAPQTKTPPATKEPPVPNHHHSSPSKSTTKLSAKTTPKSPTPIKTPIAFPSATTTPSPKPSSYSLPLDPKSVVPPAIPIEAPSDSRSSSSFSTPKKLKAKRLSILNTDTPISFSSASHPTLNIPSPSYQPSLKRSRSDPSISPPPELLKPPLQFLQTPHLPSLL